MIKQLFFIAILFLFYGGSSLSQTVSTTDSRISMEDELTQAFENAKRGVYHGLNSIKKMKSKLDDKLIDKDKLVADVTVIKEINGVKIESVGFYNSTSIKIVVYRSLDSLIKDKFYRED